MNNTANGSDAAVDTDDLSVAYSGLHGTESRIDDRQLLLRQTDFIYTQLPVIQAAQLSAAVIVFILLWQHHSPAVPVIWFLVILLIAVARFTLGHLYKSADKTPGNTHIWFNSFLLVLILSGLMWSFTGILLVPVESLQTVSFMGLVICGLSAGAVTVLSVYLRLLLLYVICALLPFAGYLILLWQHPQSTYGSLMLVFALLVMIMGWRLSVFFNERFESFYKLDQAAQLAKLAYWVWDEENDCFLAVSDMYAEILGINLEELKSGYWVWDQDFKLVHEDDQERYYGMVHHAYEQQVGYDIEYRILRPDGETRWIHEVAEPVIDTHGRTVRLIGTLQDITPLRQVQESLLQSQKNELDLQRELSQRKFAG